MSTVESLTAAQIRKEIAEAASGGSSFGGVTVATPSLKQQSAMGAGRRIWFANFTFAPYVAGQPGPGLVDHDSTSWGGICMAEAGWYQITAYAQLQFDTGTLPESFNFSFAEYNAITGFFADIPVTPGSGDWDSTRGLPGGEATLTSHVFYQEGEDVTTNRPIKFYFEWPTDAEGLYPDLRLYVAKLG